MSTRIYLVTDVETNKHRLIRAGNQAQAMRHVANALFDVKVATATQVAELIIGGVTLEHAGNQEEETE